ncbi:MAG: matrixin family metalloprotease, partial [Verrucomicrobiales bacterium]
MASLWLLPMFMTLYSMHGFVANYNQSGQQLQWFKPETSRFVSANVIHLETRTIRYYLDEAAYSETNREQELDAIRVAFDQWQSVPNTDLHFEDAGFIEGTPVINLFDNTNMIYWEKESFLVNGELDDIRGFLGLTFRAYFEDSNLVEADIVFNGMERRWTTDFANPPFGAAFTESIAMHEIGHLIGMEHSSIGSTTMMWRDRYGPNNQLDLSVDDMAFVQAYYPAKGQCSPRGRVRGKVLLAEGG